MIMKVTKISNEELINLSIEIRKIMNSEKPILIKRSFLMDQLIDTYKIGTMNKFATICNIQNSLIHELYYRVATGKIKLK